MSDSHTRVSPNGDASGPADSAITDDCRVCPLSGLGCGVAGHVVAVSGPTAIRRRLIALGLRPGASCCVLGRAPAGGPIHVRAGSVHLMLRSQEAAGVTIGVADAEGAVGGVPAV